MKLVGARNQSTEDYLYSADLTMTGAAQLVLAKSMQRSLLILQNRGVNAMNLEFGSARATCTINASGQVNAVTASNVGFNFTHPPVVRFWGGGGAAPYLGLNQPNGTAPQHPAAAHAVITAGAVSSFVIDDPGAGYLIAPQVFLFDSDLDPYGCAVPSATTGVLLLVGDELRFDATCCPTDPVAVFGTSGDLLVCRWMD